MLKMQDELFHTYKAGQQHPGVSLTNGCMALILASRKGLVQFTYLLIKVGRFPVNAVLDEICNSTALHQAASHGQTTCVAVLLSSGANVLPLDRYNQSPALLASMFGHKKTYHLLSHKESIEAKKDKRDPCDPLCRAGTTAAQVKKSFTSYIKCYDKYDSESRDSITPLDRHDPDNLTCKLLQASNIKCLKDKAQQAVVDFSRGEAQTVKNAVIKEMTNIKNKLIEIDDTYRGELRLVGSAQDGSKLYAPDEFDFNLVISGKDVEISVKEKHEEAKVQQEGRFEIGVENVQFEGNRMIETLNSAMQKCLINYVLQDKRLSLVPPGLTSTQVGVALSLAWQESQGDHMNERKYPLLLIGVDFVPVLEVKWDERISRPPLTPEDVHTMYLSNTEKGSWRCSFAQLEAELLSRQSPTERLVQLMGKTLLSFLKAEPWMPQKRKAFTSWVNLRLWSIPAPNGFCLKNAVLRQLEQNHQKASEPEDNCVQVLANMFRSMCVESSEPQGTLTPRSTSAYFGGEFESWKLGEGAPIIVRCLEETLEGKKDDDEVED